MHERPNGGVIVPGQRFVARQPIFDTYQRVFGYELLFRKGFEQYFQVDPEQACRTTLDSSLLFGLSIFMRWPAGVHKLHPQGLDPVTLSLCCRPIRL